MKEISSYASRVQIHMKQKYVTLQVLFFSFFSFLPYRYHSLSETDAVEFNRQNDNGTFSFSKLYQRVKATALFKKKREEINKKKAEPRLRRSLYFGETCPLQSFVPLNSFCDISSIRYLSHFDVHFFLSNSLSV